MHSINLIAYSGTFVDQRIASAPEERLDVIGAWIETRQCSVRREAPDEPLTSHEILDSSSANPLAGFNARPAPAQESKDHKQRASVAPIKGPLRQSRNPNYFEDASGAPLILCGSQTWNTLQDWGSKGAVRPLDFDAFVSFLKAYGHNFTVLWCTELPRFRGLPSTETSPPDFTVSPFPWMRTGPDRRPTAD